MLIELKNIQKTYNTKTGVSFRAISNVSLSFDENGMVFLLGKSGSGKTTLLNLIGGMDSIDSGSIYIGGKNLARLKTAEIDSYRNTMVGFVFQEFNLIDYMTVFENVRLALDMQSDKDDGKVERALEQVDLLDKKYEKVKNLSGGQRQRVGIARAIVKNPEIILADEPTGALDSATGEEVMKIFERLSKEKLVIIVSHDAEKAVTYADRIVEMKDGTIYRDVRRKKEGEKIDYNQIHITSNTLIRLEKGVTLQDGDVEQINEILNQKGRRAYINIDTNPQKIKAMFPNLREAVDGGDSQKQSQSANDNGEIITGKEGFVPYKAKGGEIKNVDFKKSNLPTFKALRLGLKNLKLKVAKMVITTIIAVLAFALFATAMSFQEYDLTAAYAKTIKKGDYEYIMATNAAGTNYRITDSQINSIKQANPKIGVHKQYKAGFQTQVYSPYNYSSFSFNSFIEADDATDLKLEMLEGAAVLTDFDSIIMSQAAAREYLRYGFIEGVSDYADLIGKEIALSRYGENTRYYKIAGIFKSNLDKYKSDKYDGMLFTDILNYIEGVLIVKTGFRQSLGTFGTSNGIFGFSLNNFNVDRYYSNFYLMSNNEADCKDNNIGIDFNIESYTNEWIYDEETGENYQISNELDYDNFALTDNQIFVSEGFLSQYGLYVPENGFDEDGLTKVKDFNADPDRSFEISSPYYDGNVPFYFSADIEIKGIIRNSVGEINVIASENVLRQIEIEKVYTHKVLLAISGNNKTDSALISYLHGNGYIVESDFTTAYETLLGFVSMFSTAIIVISLLLCLLVVILLFTFISSSIKLTRKQIGILRALGARRIDTFKIYALEGFAIGLLSFVIATVLLLILAPIVNAIISAGFGYYLSALTIGIKDILAVFALMLCVTIVSILIPLRKFNKITPIKAIVEKE